MLHPTSIALLSTLLAASAPLVEPPLAPTPGGYVVVSHCETGGEIYFFSDRRVLVVSNWFEGSGSVSEGTWTQEGTKLTLKLVTHFLGKGSKPIRELNAGNEQRYETYAAEVSTDEKLETAEWRETDGCENAVIRPHGLTSLTAREWLKGNFKGDFAFLSQRGVTDADLAGKSKDELSKMRNEVFASYGRIFKNPSLAMHFKAKPGYSPRFNDVNAFLSPLEKKNVDRIIEAERAAN